MAISQLEGIEMTKPLYRRPALITVATLAGVLACLIWAPQSRAVMNPEDTAGWIQQCVNQPDECPAFPPSGESTPAPPVAVTPLPEPSTASPVHLPMIESLEPVAESYWANRGVVLPTPVELFAVNGERDFLNFAVPHNPRLWLTQSTIEERGLGGRLRQCTVYVHERGRAAGLPSNLGDPMMFDSVVLKGLFVPPKCVHWARSGFKHSLGR